MTSTVKNILERGIMTYTDSQENSSTETIDYGGLVWYIENVCGGMDLHNFETHREAREFGLNVRENCPELDVEISYENVRLRLKN